MLQSYPRGDVAAVDDAARDDIDWLKDFALAVRAIRGEMSIPPGKKLPVLLRAGGEADRRRVEELGASLAQLAGLTSLDWLEKDREAPAAATGLCGSMEILVPLADVIDRDAELARLGREIDRIEGELRRLAGKLDNPKFVERAPAEVVDREREKLAAQQDALDKLLQQKETLAAST